MKQKSKKKKHAIIDPDAKPYIVINEYLQVWTGLRDGGRAAVFSDNMDEAKELQYEEQFKYLCRISNCQIIKDYI
jgi:hypothetical protein